MSKKSKVQTKPVYNPSSTFTVNGQVKSTASSTKKGANASYNMNPYEEMAYNYANQSLYQNLPNVNVFSDNTMKNLNNEVNAYLKQGISNINSTYAPTIRQMQNDIARRFGNTNNSIFMDNLNDIESKRALAISDLAQDATLKRSELVNNELSNRYNYLNFLNNYQNQVYQNMLSTLSLNNQFLNTNNAHLNGRSAANSASSSNNFMDTALSLASNLANKAIGKYFS